MMSIPIFYSKRQREREILLFDFPRYKMDQYLKALRVMSRFGACSSVVDEN